MRNVILLLAFGFGFSAQAETAVYPISQQCSRGEVAKAQSTIIPQNEGNFVVKVSAECVPADCYVLGRSRAGVWQMQLVEHATSKSGNGTISIQPISNLAASSKRQAKDEVQKLIDQGYCHKAIFYSSWDNL